MRIFVITKRTLIIWILILALVITGIILLLSFTPNAAAVSSSAMVEAYEMEVLAGRHKEVPVYSVDRADKKIALTIDAAWEDDKTPFILDTLAQYNVKATFFLCGFWVEKYPEEVKQIAAAGHEIGNHTATHPHMNQLDAKGIEKELADFEAMTTKLIGKKTALSEYRMQSRGGLGLTNYKVDEEHGAVCGIKVVDESDDLMFISSDGVIIRVACSEIRAMGRVAKGVRVMRVNEGQKVVAFTRTEAAQDEDDAESLQDGSEQPVVTDEAILAREAETPSEGITDSSTDESAE